MNKRILKGTALLCAAVLVLSSTVGCKKAESTEEEELEVGGKPRLGFAVEGVGGIASTQEEFDRMVQEAEENALKQGVALNYQNQCLSQDGINFVCSLGNDASNSYPMYIQLYGDEALTDELYLSELIMPGQAFEYITLNHAVNPGTHEAICAFTWVKIDENGEQSIHNQISIKIYLVVSE